MASLWRKAAIVLPLAMLCTTVYAVEPNADPSPAEIQTIIKKFSEKESEFARARENYTYRQSVKLDELDASGHVEGRFQIVSDIIFQPDGRRTERVVYAPVSTLQRIMLTPEDEQDLRNVQPFVLTADEVKDYYIRYVGRETLDEISCYEFAVKPKKMEKGKRYFSGIVWVDDRDLQIVKSYGRGVGIERSGDHAYPKFETYRGQVDGKYWFPIFTISENTLNFETGPVPIKMVVRYDDYKQFKSQTKIQYGGEVKSPPEPATPPQKPQ